MCVCAVFVHVVADLASLCCGVHECAGSDCRSRNVDLDLCAFNWLQQDIAILGAILAGLRFFVVKRLLIPVVREKSL